MATKTRAGACKYLEDIATTQEYMIYVVQHVQHTQQGLKVINYFLLYGCGDNMVVMVSGIISMPTSIANCSSTYQYG